ncbi:hypothetical protein [Deinococcus budaensis]|uniref:Uncharacterized protein n=1 Tax=Deinococcus budaensis TaxID=1665626 RepID=A0A7W8LPY6_9DEIO|nr:hypothetical protein [Deinococcus budaensis]MBB5234273.1 hypothetical protein [Deinococcus budaensis]
MNAVDLPLLGEPPEPQSLQATEVVRHTLSLPRGVSEYFAAQGRPLGLSGASMMALVLSRLTHQLALPTAPLQNTHRRLLALLSWHGAGPADLDRLLPPSARTVPLPWATLASNEAALELLQRNVPASGTAASTTLLHHIAGEWQVDPDWLLGVQPRPGRKVGFLTGGTASPEHLADQVVERAIQHGDLELALLTHTPGEELTTPPPRLLLLAARFGDSVELPRHQVLALVDVADRSQLGALRELARRVAASHPGVQVTGEQVAPDDFQVLITGRRHIAEVRHQASPTRWPTEELLELHPPGAADGRPPPRRP